MTDVVMVLHFRCKQATRKYHELHAPGKQPERRMHVHIPGTSFDMYERESTARHGTAHAGSRQLCVLACVVAL